MAVKTALEAKRVAEFDAQLTTERAGQLAAELEIAKARLGVQVPLDEVVFLPSLPVRVEQVTGIVGGGGEWAGAVGYGQSNRDRLVAAARSGALGEAGHGSRH